MLHVEKYQVFNADINSGIKCSRLTVSFKTLYLHRSESI